MSDELKRCPFCGVEDQAEIMHDRYNYVYYVECQACNARSNADIDRNIAVNNWNTRPLEAAAIARAERAEAAWLIDETIQADGTLRPSLSDTLARLAQVEAALAAANEDAAALDAEVVALLGCMEPGRDYDEVAEKHEAHLARLQKLGACNPANSC